MKKGFVFALNALGWLMLFAAMLMGCIRNVGLNPQIYFDLQMEAGILDEAGISEGDLRQLDEYLARYLEGSLDDLNTEIEVFGQMQPAFNERELQHMADCRRLFAPVVSVWLNGLLIAGGAALVLCGKGRRRGGRLTCKPMWLASAVIVLPLALLAFWAAVDFGAAFNFFHRVLFTNDLWLLNPGTDLLIRICPSSMFANMGLRIGLRGAAVLLGIPAVGTAAFKLKERKRKYK